MIVTDLRLGNYINYLGVATIVESIAGIEQSYVATKSSGIMPINSFKPIPLTKEWLFKFGFICMNKTSLRFKIYIDEKTANTIHVTLENVGNNPEWYVEFNGVEIISIQYIHQLQNLYKELTNQELEINNGSH